MAMSFKETNLAAPARHNPQLHEIVLSALERAPRGAVLDLPSGPGYLLRDLQEKGFRGVAGEIDTDLHVFEEIEYRQIDMTKRFPFDDASFDYVTSIEGIEHIDNHVAFFNEVARVLKPGGQLLLTTPNVNSLSSRWNFFLSGFHLAAEKPIPLDTANMYFEHINPISLPNLFFFAERAGLIVERVTTWKYKKGSIFWYILLYPFLQYALRRACFGKESNPMRRAANRRLYGFLNSRANLLGSHTICLARKARHS